MRANGKAVFRRYTLEQGISVLKELEVPPVNFLREPNRTFVGKVCKLRLSYI